MCVCACVRVRGTDLEQIDAVFGDILDPRDEDAVAQYEATLVHLRTATVGHHGRDVEDHLRVQIRVVGRQVTCSDNITLAKLHLRASIGARTSGLRVEPAGEAGVGVEVDLCSWE